MSSEGALLPQGIAVASHLFDDGNVRRWLASVLGMASSASVIRCRGVSAPMVISGPEKSLSVEQTNPTMRKQGRATVIFGGDCAAIGTLVNK